MEANHKPQPTRRPQAGFTLIELLVVMMVILVLMGLLMGVTRYARFAAKRAHARSEIEELQKVLQNYQLDNGVYPDTLIDVRDRMQEGFRATNTGDGFLVLDPWDRGYEYRLLSPTSFELFSQGPVSSIPDDDIYSSK